MENRMEENKQIFAEIKDGKYRFKLGNALEFDFKELRKQLKNRR